MPMFEGGIQPSAGGRWVKCVPENGHWFFCALNDAIISGIGGRLAMLQPVPDSGGLAAVGFSRSLLFARFAEPEDD